MGYVTVSAKIPKRLREPLKKYNIKPGLIIRKALEEEVRRRVLSELEEKAKAFGERPSHISDEEVASLIREDRERGVGVPRRERNREPNQEGALKPLIDGVTLDLAVYESLNAVWKEHKVLGRIDLVTAKELVELLKGVFDSVPLESAKGYEAEVFELASKKRLDGVRCGIPLHSDEGWLDVSFRRRGIAE